MPSYFSPGVYTVEKDISEYPVAVNSSIVGLVGFADKGPVNKATLITTPQNLIKIFGSPSEAIPGQGLEGALEILEATRSIYYVRAANSSATEASALVKIGTCPAVVVSAGYFGVSSNLYLKVQVADSEGTTQYTTPKTFAIPSGTVASTTASGQYLALTKVIGGSLDSDDVGVAQDSNGNIYIYGAHAGSGAYLDVTAYSNAAYTAGIASALSVPFYTSGTGTTQASDLVGSSIKVYGGTVTPTDFAYFVQSIYPGAGYNLVENDDGTTDGNSIEVNSLGNSKVVIEVNQEGQSEEQYKVDLTTGLFVENYINIGESNAKSDIIKGYLSKSTSTDVDTEGYTSFTARISEITDLGTAKPRVHFGGFNKQGGSLAGAGLASGTGLSYQNPAFVKPVQGTYALAGGDSGYSLTDNDANSAAILGDPAETPKTGIYALDYDELNISIAAVPDINTQTVQNGLITLAESSQSFLALVSPPYGTINTAQEAIDWTNGRAETRTAAINSSYAAVFWPWVKVYSNADGIDRWYDPVIYAARQMCFTDSVAEPWVAPAGFRRGRLTKPTQVEVDLNQGDRDSMYSGGNIINPIVNFPQGGITIFGQRTGLRTATALDRINVRRLMIYLRKLILRSTQSFVFEPNDPLTWESVVGVIQPALEEIKARRGLIAYRVVCDETTNTPVRVDRNELWCKVILQPTKAAEVVVFELNVTNQSAKLGN